MSDMKEMMEKMRNIRKMQQQMKGLIKNAKEPVVVSAERKEAGGGIKVRIEGQRLAIESTTFYLLSEVAKTTSRGDKEKAKKTIQRIASFAINILEDD